MLDFSEIDGDFRVLRPNKGNPEARKMSLAAKCARPSCLRRAFTSFDALSDPTNSERYDRAAG